MGFVLGSEDFRQIRQAREARALETDRINERNFREDAARRRRHGADDPVDPYGSGVGAPMPVNQVGLSAAQKEAQRVYNERVAAAKAAAAAEARQAGREEQPSPLPLPAPPVAGEDSLLGTYGVQPPGFTPGGKSRLGRSGAPEFAQIDPKTQSAAGMLGRAGLNEASFYSKLALLRYRRSVAGGAAGGPATGIIGQGVGFVMDDTPAKRKLRADESVITDWYDSDEAEQFFRQNPQLLDRAAQDDTAFYNQLKKRGKIVPTKLPGGGVSLPYDPTTGTVGVIPEEEAARQSEAFAAEVSPNLLAAVIQVESNWDPNAISPKGAKGLMQVMDATNKDPKYGVTPAQDDSPEERVRVGRDYLGSMLKRHKGDLDRALVAYNWGPGAAGKWIKKGADISKLPKETKDFIKHVKAAQLTVTPQQLGQAQALGAAAAPGVTPPAPGTAPAAAPGVAPAAAPAAAPGVAPAAAPGTVSVDIKQGRRFRDLPIAAPGEPKSVAKDMLTAPDLSKIKEPDIKMPFGLRTHEINTLMASRRDLRLQVLSNRGRPGSPESLKANSALSANGAMILNMTQTQALNKLQISNDPRMLNQILNRQNPGANIRISPNSDGTLRVEMGGKVIAERKDKGKLISELRRKASVELQKALTAASVSATRKTNELILKSLLDIREAHVDGNYKIIAERYKNAGLIKGINEMFKQNLDGSTAVYMAREGLSGEVVYSWEPVHENYYKNYKRGK